jgi:hypothetical protein
MKQLRVEQFLKFAAQHKTSVYACLLIVIAIISHIHWFNPFNILEFGDWQYRPDEHVQQLLTSWNTWIPFNNFGTPNILISGFPFRGVAWSVITLLGFSYDIATKITLFIPSAIGGFLAPFFLGKRLFKHNFIAFIVALFYGSTTYFLIVQTAHLPIAVAYALLPLLVYVLDKAIEENKMHYWLCLTLLFSVGIFYEVRIMFIEAFILVGYFAFSLLNKKAPLKRYYKPIIIVGLLTILINLFWLLPSKFAAASAIGEVASRGLFGDSLFDVAHSFTITKWNWTGTLVDRTFTTQSTPFYLWLVPTLCLLCLILPNRYKKQTLFFTLVTLVGIFLTKQSAEPFASAYEWLYYNLPGFVLFREASKFYIILAFGYFGLLGYSLLTLREQKKNNPLRLILYPTAALLLLLTVGMNLKPAVTTEIGGTFKPAHMPEDYKLLKKFVASQPDYFRTYWVPRESWWGYYDNTHPKVRGVDAINQDWRKIMPPTGNGHGYDLAQDNIDIFQQPYSESLFASASIKYVVVPLRDQLNNDDFYPSYGNEQQFYIDELDKVSFLKRINIGTKDVYVYENKNYSPYVSTLSNVANIEEAALTEAHEKILPQLNMQNAVVKEDQKTKPSTGETGIRSLFKNGSEDFIKDTKLESTLEIARNSILYVDNSKRTLEYRIANGQISLHERNPGILYRNNVAISNSPQTSNLLGKADLTKGYQHVISQGDSISYIKTDEASHNLGSIREDVVVSRLAKQNKIANPSFESGTWEKQVQDCNAYDKMPSLTMGTSQDNFTEGKRSLYLGAQRHTACTKQKDISITGSTDYLLSFDHQNEGSQKIGYKITFSPGNQSIRQDIEVHDKAWHTFTRKIHTPNGASKMTLELYGYPDEDQKSSSVTLYDNLKLLELSPLIVSKNQNIDSANEIALPEGKATFSYTDPKFQKINTIENGSFERGAWEQKVQDCNAYDRHPEIGMKIGTDKTQTNYLELMAKRHIACTARKAIPVEENTSYVFSLSTQSPTRSDASYYIRFNNQDGKVIKHTVKAINTEWNRTILNITTPPGATEASLTVYAVPKTDGKLASIVRYDDFSLTPIPDILTRYYAVSSPDKAPKSAPITHFSATGPTKKIIHISNVSTPFYLRMNESYHVGWQLSLSDTKNSSFFKTHLPSKPLHTIPNSEHINLSRFLNAWYIDPAAFCSEEKTLNGCHLNADGTYSMQLVAEFYPQRWFNLCLIISTVAFTGTIIATYWLFRRSKNKPGYRVREA